MSAPLKLFHVFPASKNNNAYTVGGATVEVTPDPVTAVLAEMLSPSLRELLTQAISDDSAQ